MAAIGPTGDGGDSSEEREARPLLTRAHHTRPLISVDVGQEDARRVHPVREELASWRGGDRASGARKTSALIPCPIGSRPHAWGTSRGSFAMTRALVGPAIAVVAAWHEAVNAGDTRRLAALAAEDVEVGGPRGAGRGIALLREWVERAGIRLEPERWFGRPGVVVVAQRATWRSPETGQPGDPQPVASLFLVEGGLVRGVHRHVDLAAALAAGGLTEADEAESTVA